MPKYENFSKEDLLRIVEKQEQELAQKKYGLVWDAEREPEQVVLDCENNLPVLKRVKGKEIKTCDEQDNILIEGDNYHALTVLNYTHKEKIDVIYIDPPYNTGNKDFIYNDRYVDSEDGFRHSKWLNFMEKRLNLAHDLLKKTGVIFISIDDNEVAQLKMLCDKIFGEDNFIANLIWRKKRGGGRGNSIVIPQTEYILVYSINIQKVHPFEKKLSEHKLEKYKYNDLFGRYAREGLDHHSPKGAYERKTLQYNLIIENKKIYCPTGQWLWSKSRVEKELNNFNINNKKQKEYKYLDIILDNKKRWRAYKKIRLDDGDKIRKEVALSLIDNANMTTNASAFEIKELFGEAIFNYSKPKDLIKYLVKFKNKNSIVLDFMAGSGTTGHAVLDLNREDGGNRKFILCTNNELNGLEKELKKKGISEKKIQEHGICRRVTYPRIEKVIKGYKKNGNGEKVEGLGGNLQYFTTSLVKKAKDKDQVKIDLTQKCGEMLCVKENIFNLKIEKEDFKIFYSNKKDKFLCIYFNFLEDSFDNFLAEVQKLKGKKLIYMFSLDNEIPKGLFKNVKDKEIIPIPKEILKVYEDLVRMNIPAKSEIIFIELKKACKKVFEEKEKDDGAKNLRIVLEKILQKIAQQNGINFYRQNGKEEKIAAINDKLKNGKIISQTIWEENKTYLTIGNDAMHGKYDDFDLEQVENFYRHVQKLINKFNF
ncbi:site-specific DNA-methyltransferase [Patescibacteria group bacterium]|nr:site-specific DNA-methyltransferase [Patescibacteria group bacterium]